MSSMSFHDRRLSLPRHRSFNRTDFVPPESLLQIGKLTRRRGRKIIVLSVLLLSVFFLLEWRYLSSVRSGRLPSSSHTDSPTPFFQGLRGSTMPTFERLLGLAAHALAEHDSKLEPDDLWNEPAQGSYKWKPCADERPSGHTGPPAPPHSSGYIMVNADGGLNQQRVAVCNAVAVARLLNATLVLPQFLYSSVWKDSSQFGDIYEEKYFVDYLKDDVHIVSELPLDLQSLDLEVIGSILTNSDVPKESKPSFFVNVILPILLRNRVVQFYGFANALTFDPIPSDIQRLRCRCNYHALQFRPHIKQIGGLIIKRMRDRSLRWGPNGMSWSEPRLTTLEKKLVGDDGISRMVVPRRIQGGIDTLANEDELEKNQARYLGLHLRFEKDMVAYSLCEFGGGEAERQDLAEFRELHFPTLTKYQEAGQLMSAAQLREEGRCPLTPEEAVLMLASLGFKRSTRIFLAGSQIYGGQARMATISSLFPNLVTKEDLLTSDEIAPFLNHTSQMAALDFIGCAASDAFAMTDPGSQLSSLVSGYRIYYGEGQLPTIRPNKRRLAKIFAKNMTIEWEDFEERIRKTVRESKRLVVRPVARSVYRHPRCQECMCN